MDRRRVVAVVAAVAVGATVGLGTMYLLTGEMSVGPLIGGATFLLLVLAWKKRRARR